MCTADTLLGLPVQELSKAGLAREYSKVKVFKRSNLCRSRKKRVSRAMAMHSIIKHPIQLNLPTVHIPKIDMWAGNPGKKIRLCK